MKKVILLVILFASISAVKAQAVWNNTSFVHRSNQQILDGKNNVIKLDGFNLGAWLNWEGWMWGGGFTPEKEMNKSMVSIIGNTAMDSFKDTVYKNFITRADIKKIAQLGFNVVRVPFNHTLLEDDLAPFVYKKSGWTILDSVLKWCEDFNVYAVLDLHSVPGGASPTYTSDPDSITIWQSDLNKKRTVETWKAMARRYRNRGIVAGYDLINEPNVTNQAELIAMYNTIIDSIRLVDTKHMFFLEGNNYAQDFSMFNSLHDQNTCFEFHVYTWFYSNKIAENLLQYTTLSQKLNAPVWCGEWGENNLSQLDATIKILKNPKNNFSGQAFWTWKKMKSALQLPGQVNYPFLVGIDNTPEWDKVSTWINNKNADKPTKKETEEGIEKFTQSIKLKNCSLNSTLLDILKQTKDTTYTEHSSSVKFNFPSILSLSGAAYPGMSSVPESNNYNFYNGTLTLTFPLFAKLHLGTLKKPIRYSGLFCSGSAGVANFQSSTNISPLPLYSGFLGLTYIKGSIKNNYIAGIYAFENADQNRFLDASPSIAGLFLYAHQNRRNNTFIAGGGVLVFNNNGFAVPVIGYIGKISEKFSFLVILPVVATLNFKPNENNRFSLIFGPQGNFYKLKGNTFSIADTTVNWNKINLQTGAIKNGFSWSKKINNQFEWYSEAGILVGNSITLTNNETVLKEATLPSIYVQIGLTITLNPNRLETGLKQSNERKQVDKNFNKQKTNPSIFNIERIFLD